MALILRMHDAGTHGRRDAWSHGRMNAGTQCSYHPVTCVRTVCQATTLLFTFSLFPLASYSHNKFPHTQTSFFSFYWRPAPLPSLPHSITKSSTAPHDGDGRHLYTHSTLYGIFQADGSAGQILVFGRQ